MSDPSKLDDLLVRLDADLLYRFTERAGIMEYDGGSGATTPSCRPSWTFCEATPGPCLGCQRCPSSWPLWVGRGTPASQDGRLVYPP